MFGPPGWIAAVVTLVSAEVISEMQDRRKKQDVDEQLYKTAVSSFGMPEIEAVTYMATLTKKASEPAHIWGFDAWKANMRKFGPNAYDLTMPLPQQVRDGIPGPLNLLPGIHNEEVRQIIKKSYLEETTELQNRLKYAAMTGGRNSFDKAAVEAMRSATAYDATHHTHTRETTDAAVQEALFYMLDGAENERTGRNVHHGSQQNERWHEGNPAQSRSVVISRPLIEHLTINAGNTDEGIRRMKQKVEEVLLEILNSANAIH
jgi:hypothetical protein